MGERKKGKRHPQIVGQKMAVRWGKLLPSAPAATRHPMMSSFLCQRNPSSVWCARARAPQPLKCVTFDIKRRRRRRRKSRLPANLKAPSESYTPPPHSLRELLGSFVTLTDVATDFCSITYEYTRGERQNSNPVCNERFLFKKYGRRPHKSGFRQTWASK